MNNRLKIFISSAVFLLLAFSTLINPNRILPHYSSISTEAIVIGVGVDTDPENKNGMMITLAQNMDTPSDSGGGGEQKSIIKNSVGESFNEALSNIQKISDKSIFLGHTQVLVVGEDAAKENFKKYVEYMAVSPNIRMDISTFIAKNATAKEVLELDSIGGVAVYDKLLGFTKNGYNNSLASPGRLPIIISKFENELLYASVPAIEIIEKDTASEKEVEKDIKLHGYAIFKGQKLLTYLNDKQSITHSILNNKLIYTSLDLEDTPLGLIALEMYDATTEMKYISDNDIGKIKINVYIMSRFSEQYLANKEGVRYTSENVSMLEKLVNMQIKDDIMKLINTSKKMNEDFLSFSNVIYRKSTRKWDELSEKWSSEFKNLPVEVEVQTKIVN